MAFIQVDNLRRQYGQGEARVVALNDVSLTIDQGAFVAVMGSSGSGKSTLLHLLGGVDKPDAGRVIIDGTDLYTLSETELTVFRRRRIGLIYQFFNLVPELTVEENILLPQLLDGKAGDKQQLEELLAATGLSDRRRHLPSQLSGGQQQRVAIARALVNRPALVLADEPTGNLDTRNGHEVMQLLRLANRDMGQTLVLITHDERIARQADRVLTIEDGRIVDDQTHTGENT
ncbi:MAG TPA: ABC transporter ATP-binding protein [Clostridiales bacterium]|nr:ABC transporter ATP-binding protein [Clostridiales bacterium]